MIRVLLVGPPWVVAENCVHFQETKDEDQAADQLIPGNVTHAVVVVVQVEAALESQGAGHVSIFSLVAQHVFTDRAGVADVVAHIIVCGPDHVAHVAFVNELRHSAGCEFRDIVRVRLNGGKHFPFVRRAVHGPLDKDAAGALLRPRAFERQNRYPRQDVSEKVAPLHGGIVAVFGG